MPQSGIQSRACSIGRIGIIRGVGGVLEVVRPKVGAAEGCVGGGCGGPPTGKFCKKTQNPVFWELLAHFTHTSGAVYMQSSRVQ